MAGYKMGTNGRVCLNASGQAINCACKCGNHCNTGTAPTSWTITSTGITLGTCTCQGTTATLLCGGPPATNISSTQIDRMPTASFNGTYSLTTYNEVGAGFPSTEACQWSGGTLDTMDYSVWQGRACDRFTEVGAMLGCIISWEIVRLFNQWRLFLQVLPGLGTNTTYMCWPPRLFYGSLTASEPGDCNNVLTFTNEIATPCQILTLSSGETVTAIASGGTVVCTPIP